MGDTELQFPESSHQAKPPIRGMAAGLDRKMASLQEVILIAQEEIRVEHHVRQADHRWLLHGDWIGAGSGPLALVNPPVTLPLADV